MIKNFINWLFYFVLVLKFYGEKNFDKNVFGGIKLDYMI